jgi:predicted phosphodiesterase
MRIAVISDLHGNLLALEAVLADIEQRGVDEVVNLGDLVSGGLAPAATADRLMELGQHTVRGNHERQVLQNPYERMSMSDRLAHDQLTEVHRAWFASLPLTAEIAPGVLAFHGSPYNDLVYLLETVEPDGARPATEEEITARLGEYASWPLLLCGHTHLQRQVRLGSGALVVNPGSAGWPAYDDDKPYPHVMESGSPHARYAIADNTSGSWDAELLAVEYDWEAAARLAESNGRLDVAGQLRTGLAR